MTKGRATISGEVIRKRREDLGWSRTDLSLRASIPLAVLTVVEDSGNTDMLFEWQMDLLIQEFEKSGVNIFRSVGDGHSANSL